MLVPTAYDTKARASKKRMIFVACEAKTHLVALLYLLDNR
jgi:hypothetical protein